MEGRRRMRYICANQYFIYLETSTHSSGCEHLLTAVHQSYLLILQRNESQPVLSNRSSHHFSPLLTPCCRGKGGNQACQVIWLLNQSRDYSCGSAREMTAKRHRQNKGNDAPTCALHCRELQTGSGYSVPRKLT